MKKMVAEHIYGYTYGTAARSPVTLDELEALKVSAGFTAETERLLKLAGDVLGPQTEQVVQRWRNEIIVSVPNLARHSRSPEGNPLPNYSAQSGLRFQQWILDTCFRSYDQDWLNYQQEIALRHTSIKKNQTDGVRSTPYIPLRDILSFIAVMNETVKPFLAASGNTEEEVSQMHQAWCTSMQLQLALWTKPYADKSFALNEW